MGKWRRGSRGRKRKTGTREVGEVRGNEVRANEKRGTRGNEGGGSEEK